MSLAPVSTAPETVTRRSSLRMHVLMAVATAAWAANIVAGKEALDGFSALALSQLRVAGAAIMFGAAFLARSRRRGLRASRRQWIFLVAMAFSGIALNQLTFIGGMARSTVAHTGLIVALGPVMVLGIAVVARMESLTVGKLAGMMVAFAGVAILTADGPSHGAGSYWLGDLILLFGVLVFAVYTILMKEVAGEFDALTLNTLTFVLGSLMMFPFCTKALLNTSWATVPPRAWWGLAYMVVVGTVISYLLFAYVLTELPASRAAAFNYLQPVVASALGIWILSEHLTSRVLVGGIIILAGVYLTERERGEASATEDELACAEPCASELQAR